MRIDCIDADNDNSDTNCFGYIDTELMMSRSICHLSIDDHEQILKKLKEIKNKV